jgi:hypothetical protein
VPSVGTRVVMLLLTVKRTVVLYVFYRVLLLVRDVLVVCFIMSIDVLYFSWPRLWISLELLLVCRGR